MKNIYAEFSNDVTYNNQIVFWSSSFSPENLGAGAAIVCLINVNQNSSSNQRLVYPMDRTLLQGFIFQTDYEKILNDNFYFINADEINHFLVLNPEIVPYIIESYKEIVDRFLYIKPNLELIKDIEMPEWETLQISIPSIYNDDISFLKLNDLLKNWMFAKPKKFKRLVSLKFYVNDCF